MLASGEGERLARLAASCDDVDQGNPASQRSFPSWSDETLVLCAISDEGGDSGCQVLLCASADENADMAARQG
jgi:hypothetical protein